MNYNLNDFSVFVLSIKKSFSFDFSIKTIINFNEKVVKKLNAMLSSNFSIVDYFVFAFLLISSSMIGIFFWHKSRKNVSNAEFLTGKRKLSMFPVCLSLVASFLSTNTLLGVPAEVYQVGTQFSLQVVSFVIAVVLAAEVFLPIYYRLEMMSVNQVSHIDQDHFA